MTADPPQTPDLPPLAPLPYHEAIRDYLKEEETELWNWYASNKVRDEQADAVRFDLLKSTYRLEPSEKPDLYAAAEEVAGKLGLDVPITIYQAQNPEGLNASLAYLPSEAHVVLHGPLASKLSADELRALLAHELSHLLLWRGWDGDYLIVDQILAAMTHDARAETPHFASARLFGLYTEIFCDRGALFVAEDPLVVVAMLVKVQTQLDEVSAESYIRQAEEIFSKSKAKADQLTHPEAFIRARSVTLWAKSSDADTAAADRKITEMIEGGLVLDELDLIAQRRVAALTRRLLDALLWPRWIQTDSVLAHARMFFDDYAAPQGEVFDERLAGDVRSDDKPMNDYYCYLLLDFATADRDLEELPLAAALTLADRLGLKARFAELARRELRLRKKQLEKIDKEREKLLAQADRQAATT